MRYAAIVTSPDGGATAVRVLPLEKVPLWDPDDPAPGTCAVPDGVEDGWVLEGGAWGPPPPPAPEVARRRLIRAVEARLDAFAQGHDFMDMNAACSFVTSNVPAWRADALLCVDLRDRTWLAFYAALDADPATTLDDLLAQLPALEWPE